MKISKNVNPTLKSKFKIFYPQWLAGIGVCVIMIEIGVMCGWSSPYLAQLTKPSSLLFLTSSQAAWVASLLNLGRFLGAVCGAFSVNYLGSKQSLTLSIVPIGCCWIFTIVASSSSWLYAARACGGFGFGMTYSCLAFYVGEVALPEIRGALVSLGVAGGASIGYLLSSIGGTYLNMDVSAGVYLIPCIFVLMLFMWLPSTPHWLVKIENFEDANKSIAWYKPGIDVNEEFSTVKNLVFSDESNTVCGKLRRLKSEPIRKAMILILILSTFMQITGFNSLFFYMETIFTRSNLTIINPSTAVIYVHISGVLSSAASVYLIDKCGRKFLLMLSCAGIVSSMAGLVGHSYLMSNDYDLSTMKWLPIVSVFVFTMFYFIGLMSVPSAVLSEIFPSDIKSIAGCAASLVGGVWAFLAARSFQLLLDSIGEIYIFLIHGLLALILIPYVYVFMPETKGKSLQEIQDKFMRI